MASKNSVEIVLSARDQATRALKAAFGGVQATSTHAINAIRTTAGIAGTALAALKGAVLAVGVSYDAMAESSQVAWNTLLGSQAKAKKMVQDIANFAKNTQFDNASVDAMAKYMFNAGYAGQKLFDQLTKIADIAGAFNIPADSAQELARQMSQVVQSGTAYTEDLNILQDRGVPIYKALSEQLQTTVGDVKQLASKGKISADEYMAAFDNVAKSVKGASDAQAQTFQGMVSTLKDSLGQLAGQLAKPIFEKLKVGMEKLIPVAGALLSYAQGDMKGFTKTIDEAFGSGAAQKLTGFANGLKRTIDGIKAGFSTLKTTFGGIKEIFKGGANEGTGISMLSMAGLNPEQISAVQTAVGKIKNAMIILKGSFDIFKGNGIDGTVFMTKMGLSTDTIVKVVHVVNGIRNAIVSFITEYTGYIKGLFSGGGNLGETFGKIFNTAKSIIMPILTDIVAFVKDKIAMIKQFWDENGAQITQAIQNVWAVIAAIFKAVAPVILFIVKMLWDNVKGVIDGALKILMGLIQVFAALFTGNFSKMWEAIKNIFFGAIEFVWNLVNLLLVGKLLGGIKALVEGGVSHFTGFWTKVVEIFKNLDTYLWDIVKGMVTKVVGWFRSLYTEGANIFGTLRTFGANAFEAMWQAIRTVAGNIASGVKGFFLDMYTGAKFRIQSLWDTAKTVFGFIRDAITNPIRTAKDTVTGIFNKIVDAAKNIPGGIAQGITGFMNSAISSIEDLAHNLVKKFKKALGINSPSKVFTEMGGHIISGLINGLSVGSLKDLGATVFKDFGGGIFNTFEKIKGFLTGNGAGGNVASWISQALAITGAPASWLGPLSTLVQHESGGNPNAINLWDSNAKAGHPSKGLFQTIDSTFNAYAIKGLGGIYNPIANAVAGIRYIMARYGNVWNVPGIKSMMGGGKYKGYYTGARVSDKQLAWVAEKGPEYVIPTDSGSRAYSLWQQAGKENGFIGNGGAAINVTLNYTGSGSKTDAYTMVDIVERELVSRLGLNLRISGAKG